MEPISFKVVLVGDGGVGKTTYINKLRNDNFERKYIATQGVDVHPLTFNTNYGTIIFKVWDCAGQEKFGGLRDGYYINADAAIFMFSVDSKLTFDHLGKWIKSVNNIVGDKPFVVCGNKCDKERKIMYGAQPNTLEQMMEIIENPCNSKYFDIAVICNYNLEKPWVSLARQLTGYTDLELVYNMEI